MPKMMISQILWGSSDPQTWVRNHCLGTFFKKLILNFTANFLITYCLLIGFCALAQKYKFENRGFVPKFEDLTSTIITSVKKDTFRTIFILRKDLGVGGWFRKWQFSLNLSTENVHKLHISSR